MKFIYFDNPFVRSLSNHPEIWDNLFDLFVKTFGRRFKPIQSYYLFFEYIGFTKKELNIPVNFKKPCFENSKELNSLKKATENLAILDKNLSKIGTDIRLHIKEKLYDLKPLLTSKINKRKNHTSLFQGSQELVNILFGDILVLIENNFEQFIEFATTYLTWDVWCSINPLGIPLNIVRERQLGFWLEKWEDEIELPFGKIIDDLARYYKMNFESQLKNHEDMVDSEMLTYLILGYRFNDEIHRVHCLTYPPKNPKEIPERNELALGTINNIEKTLGKTILKKPGKIYVFDKEKHDIKEINEPIFSINHQ